VQFSNTAEVLLPFTSGPGVAANLSQLVLAGEGPTFAASAFVTVRNELLLGGGSAGFRDFAVPLIVVTVTDGLTLTKTIDPTDLERELQAAPFTRPAPELVRLSIDIGQPQPDPFEAPRHGNLDLIGRDGRLAFAEATTPASDVCASPGAPAIAASFVEQAGVLSLPFCAAPGSQ